MNIVLRSVLLFACCLAPSVQAASPAETVESFHKALLQGDGSGVLNYLATDVVIFEQGYINTKADYAKAQLKDAADFARKTQRTVTRREFGQDTDVAWVFCSTETTGNFSGRKLDLLGTETMLMRRDGDAWKITHIHWSAHPRDQ